MKGTKFLLETKKKCKGRGHTYNIYADQPDKRLFQAILTFPL